MASTFDEAFQRVRRAEEHLTELESELLRFERPEFVEMGTIWRKEDSRTEEEINEIIARAGFGANRALDSLKVPPKVNILVGEIAYNLVAALDYLIFLLAKTDSGSEQDGTQFPVCAKREFFDRGRSSMLKGVSDEHIALLERLQPYSGCTWTQSLKNLSNLDKHRQLIQARVSPFQFIGFDCPLTEVTPIIQSGAIANAIAADTRVLPMKTYVGSSRIITLDDGSPIIKTLTILKSQVSDVLVQFEHLLN